AVDMDESYPRRGVRASDALTENGGTSTAKRSRDALDRTYVDATTHTRRGRVRLRCVRMLGASIERRRTGDRCRATSDTTAAAGCARHADVRRRRRRRALGRRVHAGREAEVVRGG